MDTVPNPTTLAPGLKKLHRTFYFVFIIVHDIKGVDTNTRGSKEGGVVYCVI